MSSTGSASNLRAMVYHPQSFSRLDEQDDRVFYEVERFVQHLDDAALQTVREVIGTLVVEPAPTILDLMASFDSHLPARLEPGRVVGVGMNRAELESNKALDSFEVIDLNSHPRLPFDDDSFDVVLNTVSVDYLTRPFEVFREVQRVLRPGGMHLVLFSNRMFRSKAVRIWREASDEERFLIVEDYFASCPGFGATERFMSKGRLRAADDKYANVTRLGDPVFAVWAEKQGSTREWERPMPRARAKSLPSETELAARRARTRETLRCPYCEARMRKWEVPLSPFSDWDVEFLYVCMNDECPYVQRGWSAMARQGVANSTYRPAYDKQRDSFMPIVVPNLRALQDGIVDDD